MNIANSCFFKRSRGFTFFELVVVIALIVIMSAIAIPKIASVMPNYRLKEAARTLYMDLQLSRSTAIKEGTACTVEFNSGGYQIFLDLNQNLERDGNETSAQYLVKQVAWSSYKDVAVQANTFTANDNGNPAISFRSDGLSYNNGGGFGAGRVVLGSSSNGQNVTVSVTATGSIRLE